MLSRPAVLMLFKLSTQECNHLYSVNMLCSGYNTGMFIGCVIGLFIQHNAFLYSHTARSMGFSTLDCVVYGLEGPPYLLIILTAFHTELCLVLY